MPRLARLPRLGRWPRLVLAGFCLLLAAVSATSARGTAGRSDITSTVVIATRDLPAGHRLVAADLRRARWPASLVPAGAADDERALLGRRVAGPVAARDVLSRPRLIGNDLTTGLPAGTLAVPLTVSGGRIADLLRAGDRVSLVATGRSDDGFTDSGGAHVVQLVAERLLVLSVLPGRDGTATDLVVAADRVTALRLVRVGVSQVLAALGDNP